MNLRRGGGEISLRATSQESNSKKGGGAGESGLRGKARYVSGDQWGHQGWVGGFRKTSEEIKTQPHGAAAATESRLKKGAIAEEKKEV